MRLEVSRHQRRYTFKVDGEPVTAWEPPAPRADCVGVWVNFGARAEFRNLSVEVPD